MNTRAGWFAGATTAIAAAALMLACTGPRLKQELVRPVPGYALPAATEGPLAGIAHRVVAAHGEDASGFLLLDANKAALDWRLALIDSARSSIDIQTYLWYPDNAGRLLLERAILAARRGVHVRLIVDDLLTIGLDQSIVQLQDDPNIEFRLFNPWKERHIGARAAELLVEMERLNIRMHNKLMIVDGVAAIIGGRNLGDHYFGLSHKYNFNDLDVLAFGQVAEQAEGMFDHFWNSKWVVSAGNLDVEPDPAFGAKAWTRLQKRNRKAADLAAFPHEPMDWSDSLAAVEGRLHAGTGMLVYDEAPTGRFRRTWVFRYSGFSQAQSGNCLSPTPTSFRGRAVLTLYRDLPMGASGCGSSPIRSLPTMFRR